MIKLIRAGLNRLKKNALFWGVALFTAAMSFFLIYTNYMDKIDYDNFIEIEQLFINNIAFTGVIIAAFASLFIGQEYSDGTLRNKVILKFSRVKIYLSNFILVSAVSVLMEILHLLIIALIGIPIFGSIQMPLDHFAMILLCVFVNILAYSAIFTFLAMILSNKAINAVTSLLLAFTMMIVSLTLINKINAPEYITVARVVNDQYTLVDEKNPKYLSEGQRTAYTHVLRSIPTGQCFLLAGRMETDISTLPFYSFTVILFFTGSGLFLFKQKELK